MEVSEFQALMKKLYYEKDAKRGAEKTLLWLVEEVGELSEALREKKSEAIEEELADIVAWTASLANILDVDLEKALQKKYPCYCSCCGKMPCECEK